MRKIKTAYAVLPNFGDLLNILIMNKVFGIEITASSPERSELSGIGSGLGTYTYTDLSFLKKLKKKVINISNPTVHVWGTGFIEDRNWDVFYKSNMIFSAIRGELSRKVVNELLNTKIVCPTGDGGLLASFLIDEKIEKKYKVGVIPHFKEQDNNYFRKIKEKFADSIIIDVKKDPLEVVKEIAACEIIISSSLHGLIVADSFGIPNHHIVVTNNLLGDGFKFRDYYSAYNVKYNYTDINIDGIDHINAEFVKNSYELTNEMIEKKKKDLIEAFPFNQYKMKK